MGVPMKLFHERATIIGSGEDILDSLGLDMISYNRRALPSEGKFYLYIYMQLVIVESPTKAKTITKFLGDDYVVRASMGHVMDLPKSKLGIDLEHDFAPQYEIVADKKALLSELKKLAKEATNVVLATDPDREGEAIASHIQDVLSAKSKQTFSRVVFHEITKDAIADAFKHPRTLDTHLVDAQTARRVLDRLVGYKLSPVLWQKVRRGLSAGRVQSVALRLIVEREKEIAKFAKEEYWTIAAMLRHGDPVKKKSDKEGIEFALIEINDKKIESSQTYTLYDGEYKVSKTSIETELAASELITDLKTKEYIVEDVLRKETKRSPQPPFTTSTLQQEASRRFGFSGKRTMSFAQKLYEEGFITYHRTDSVHLADSAVAKMQEYITKEFGASYLPLGKRVYKAKQKLAQEAHEAIRPTDVYRDSKLVSERLGIPYGKVYDLIWRRAIASQMADAKIESTTVFVLAQKGVTKTTYRFKTTGSVLLFEGFLKLNPHGLGDRKLPEFAVSESLDLLEAIPTKHETPAPPRYNDASIISSLEEAGIGRPSTYATIIGTIEARKYIEREQGRFSATAIGIAVTEFLVEHFGDIDDIPFTAKIEDELDQVAKGEKSWVPVMREFYEPLAKKLETIGEASRVKIPVEETKEICPLDGAPVVIRTGKFGKFYSCSNFPTCTYKKAYMESVEAPCPKDAGRILVRKTKKGRTFYGCENYPKCTFAVWNLKDIPGLNSETPQSE